MGVSDKGPWQGPAGKVFTVSFPTFRTCTFQSRVPGSPANQKPGINSPANETRGAESRDWHEGPGDLISG